MTDEKDFWVEERTDLEIIAQAKKVLKESSFALYGQTISELDDLADVLNALNAADVQSLGQIKQNLKKTENDFKNQIEQLKLTLREHLLQFGKEIMDQKKKIADQNVTIKCIKELKRSISISGSNIKSTQIIPRG